LELCDRVLDHKRVIVYVRIIGARLE